MVMEIAEVYPFIHNYQNVWFRFKEFWEKSRDFDLRSLEEKAFFLGHMCVIALAS